MAVPVDGEWKRDAVLRETARGADFDLRYDFTTLAYSGVFLAPRQAVVLICPKLLNFETLVRSGQFHSELGAHKLLGIRRLRRHSEIWLSASVAPDTMTFTAGDIETTCDVHAPDATPSGLNALTTLSKDNDLTWIDAWARHYASTQGVEHILFFDNGSTTYSAEQITEILANVPGLVSATVVNVPLPFGALGTHAPHGIALFLQPALLNLARYRFLPMARTVLNCDIDEMLISDDGRLCDVAMRSMFGYATARAHWRYRPAGATDVPRYGDHILRADPDATTKEKMCIRPNGLLGRAHWDIHGAAGYWFNRLCMAPGHRFYHCESIATSWKRPRDTGQSQGLIEDRSTIENWKSRGLL
jgi:hypothetical protein